MDNVFATFLKTAGLYHSIEICENNITDLIELIKGNIKISTYCKECNNNINQVVKMVVNTTKESEVL